MDVFAHGRHAAANHGPGEAVMDLPKKTLMYHCNHGTEAHFSFLLCVCLRGGFRWAGCMSNLEIGSFWFKLQGVQVAAEPLICDQAGVLLANAAAFLSRSRRHPWLDTERQEHGMAWL